MEDVLPTNLVKLFTQSARQRRMTLVSTRQWESLENWGPIGFFVAGILLLFGLALLWFDIFQGVSAALAFIGVICVFIGLFGMYPRMNDTAPNLALAGLVAVTIALISIGVGIPLRVGIGPDPGPLPWMVGIVSGGVSFLLYGVASVWTRTPSLEVGLLLLVPAVAWPGYFAVEQLLGRQIGWLPLAAFAIVAVAMLATGYLLHVGYAPPDRAKSSPP